MERGSEKETEDSRANNWTDDPAWRLGGFIFRLFKFFRFAFIRVNPRLNWVHGFVSNNGKVRHHHHWRWS
jgi:hypothetical protein